MLSVNEPLLDTIQNEAEEAALSTLYNEDLLLDVKFTESIFKPALKNPKKKVQKSKSKQKFKKSPFIVKKPKKAKSPTKKKPNNYIMEKHLEEENNERLQKLLFRHLQLNPSPIKRKNSTWTLRKSSSNLRKKTDSCVFEKKLKENNFKRKEDRYLRTDGWVLDKNKSQSNKEKKINTFKNSSKQGKDSDIFKIKKYSLRPDFERKSRKNSTNSSPRNFVAPDITKRGIKKIIKPLRLKSSIIPKEFQMKKIEKKSQKQGRSNDNTFENSRSHSVRGSTQYLNKDMKTYLTMSENHKNQYLKKPKNLIIKNMGRIKRKRNKQKLSKMLKTSRKSSKWIGFLEKGDVLKNIKFKSLKLKKECFGQQVIKEIEEKKGIFLSRKRENFIDRYAKRMRIFWKE